MTTTIGSGGTDTTAAAMDIVMIPALIGGTAGGMIVTILGMTGIADTIMIAITTMINFRRFNNGLR